MSLAFFNIPYIVFVLCVGWYLITNLQWYNYKLERVIFKHHKREWHFVYLVMPVVFYLIFSGGPMAFFFLLFIPVYVIMLFFWNKKLDRKLVLTSRVKRFFAVLFVFAVLSSFISLTLPVSAFVLCIVLTLIITTLLEKLFFLGFKNKAKKKLQDMKNLQIVAITASYGKTSIKNYLYYVLKKKYKTYKTPRSVNTIGGIVLDVNRDLPQNTQVYIAEAGARVKGDIEEITSFLEPQICVIGSVGEQHIEYFKTLDNIIATKMEILSSQRMDKAFVHESVKMQEYDNVVKFPNNLHIVQSSLDGIWFDVQIEGQIEHFYAPILGSFNAINLTAVILVAYELGMSIDEIKSALKELPSVEHRLQKINLNGKLIIDDSFNGNLEGMLEAVNICSTYTGRKVIVTPGIVESTSQANILLAKAINETFDYVIITGSLNSALLSANIDENKVFVLKDKSKLQDVLKEETRVGDLILFANDAPSFI